MKNKIVLSTILLIFINCKLFGQQQDSLVFRCVEQNCVQSICFLGNGEYRYFIQWDDGRKSYNDGTYYFNPSDSTVSFAYAPPVIDSFLVLECQNPNTETYSIVFLLKDGSGYAPVEKVELVGSNGKQTINFEFGNGNAFVNGLEQKPKKIIVKYFFCGPFEVKLNYGSKGNLIFIMADQKLRPLPNDVIYFHTPWNHPAKVRDNVLLLDGHVFIADKSFSDCFDTKRRILSIPKLQKTPRFF